MQKTNTIDPAEVAKFEAMAAEWWDTEGKFKPLHLMSPCRLDYITSQIAAGPKTVKHQTENNSGAVNPRHSGC